MTTPSKRVRVFVDDNVRPKKLHLDASASDVSKSLLMYPPITFLRTVNGSPTTAPIPTSSSNSPKLGMPVAQLTIKSLPTEMLVKVFSLLDVPDIGMAKKVSKQWASTIDEHSTTLWEAQCKKLGILRDNPTKDDRTLGRASVALTKQVAVLRARINRSSRGGSRRSAAVKTTRDKMAEAYRNYYTKYSAHVCACCNSIDNARPHDQFFIDFKDGHERPYNLCECCAILSKHTWIRRWDAHAYFKLTTINVLTKTRSHSYKRFETPSDNYGKLVMNWGTFHYFKEVRACAVQDHGEEKTECLHDEAIAHGVIFKMKTQHLRQA